jgi:type I restriction enzyme S subunit
VTERRPSGIEWVGDIPAHWATPPLFARYDVALGKMLNPEAASGQYQRPYLGNQHVQWDHVRVDDLPTMSIAPNELERYRVLPGDLLVCEGGEIGRTAVWRGEIAECCFQKAVHRMRPRNREDSPRFMYYAMAAAAWRGAFDAEGNRSTIIHLTGEKLRRQRFPFPPAREQRRIADFLDQRTAVIDELIAKKEHLVALLAEKRQALITQLVTKGLDPSVPMKDSGIEWMGQVPAHWTLKRLKHISPAQTVGVVVNPSSYYADEGIPFVFGGNIREGRIETNGIRHIGLEHDAVLAKSRLRSGDLVVVRVGYPGVAAVVPESLDGANCASVMLVRRGRFDSRWLCYALNSRLGRYQVELVQYGAAQEQFNISHAVEWRFPVPPIDEQARIADTVDGHVCASERALAVSAASIERLREYRQALITAAVTGQLDVTDERAVAAHDERVEAVR